MSAPVEQIVPGSVWRNRQSGQLSTVRRTYWDRRGVEMVEFVSALGHSNIAHPGYFRAHYDPVPDER
jgi:hypothetical protein